MYLSKNASGTYYTRLPLPKSLRDRGLPFAIRTSLCTKDRQLAVERNLVLVARVRTLIAATPRDVTPRSVYRWVRAELDARSESQVVMLDTLCDDFPSQMYLAGLIWRSCPSQH